MKDKSFIQLKKDIYLRDVTRRWKSELNTDKKVYILSPYITSKTAESVVEHTKNCEIYTVFNIENFLIGTSSIATLKNLIKKGFRVYHVAHLHAKIILVTDTFVSIGSQNLTNQGTKSKEATFTSTSLEVVKFIENEISTWISESKEISLDIVEFVEKELRPLKKKQKELKKNLENVEEFVKTKERQLENNEQRGVNAQLLRINIDQATRGNKYIQGNVQKRGNNETFVPDHKFKNQLLKWRVNFASINLEKSYRYLVITANSGKLGWGKVNNNQITFFAKSFSSANQLKIVSKDWFNIKPSYKITFIANWDAKTLRDYNLEILVTTSATPIQQYSGCKLTAWFDLKRLKINFNEISYFDIWGLKDWVEENRKKFREILEEELVKSFRYKEKNLQGVKADGFLHFYGKYKLTVGEVDSHHLLIFSEIY